MPVCHFETFPALSALPVLHAFTGRVAGLDVKVDRTAALALLATHHEEIRRQIGEHSRKLITAEQVHGARVVAVTARDTSPIPGADALITDDPAVCLGIYVADCGPVWLVDPVRRAIACIHSGRKGTELGITAAAIEAMVISSTGAPSHSPKTWTLITLSPAPPASPMRTLPPRESQAGRRIKSAACG